MTHTGVQDGIAVAEDRAEGRAAEACFHCGTPCGAVPVKQQGRAFCCRGCALVHDLLRQSGLDHFYELETYPGSRVGEQAEAGRWAYLDSPEMQGRLLDFTDGKTSRVTFQVPGIHCVACVWLLENLFRLHHGIGQSQVNFLKREVAIAFAPERIKLSELVGLLSSIGYPPTLTLGTLERPPRDPTTRRRALQVGVAGFAFGNIMLFSLPLYLGLDSLSGPLFRTVFGSLSLLLALPVLLFSASDYWKSALLSFRRRALTLDVPIALGLAALYAESAWEIGSGTGEGYLDSLSGLVFFLLCGRAFQRKTHERLAFDLDYRSFFPLAVLRRTANREERVALSDLMVGDRLILRHGELVPADARLVSGAGLIDYSFVTGESEPVVHQPGDHLYAGGQQRGGAIEVETIKPVSQGYLTSLWNHEAFRKEREEDLNTQTNRYSRRFTWLVVAVALGAAGFWVATGDAGRGVKAFTSVLIVACPCALALAAPFTLGTTQRWLGRAGVHLKNALVLERIARVDTVVFDKTGTLTAAADRGVSFVGTALTHVETRAILAVASHSIHPYAVRITDYLSQPERRATVESFQEFPGEGIRGRVDGEEWWLGSRVFLEARGVKVPTAELPPGSSVHVAMAGQHRGVFVLASRLRPDADRLLRQLDGHYELALLSGDHPRERERFRELFGHEPALHFNQSPLDKLGFIRELQTSGRMVMMVGDGLNDAGALRQSDVGVAVVEHAGAFSPASDLILEASCVPRLAEVMDLARTSARIVRWGFAVSALYNTVGVAIAASGRLSPVICAVLMPLSSVTVVVLACGAASWAARRSGLNFGLNFGLEPTTDPR